MGVGYFIVSREAAAVRVTFVPRWDLSDLSDLVDGRRRMVPGNGGPLNRKKGCILSIPYYLGVQQVFVNTDYHHDNIYTDIAMLLLATPLTLSANVAAITLGTQLPAAGAAITVVGWGIVPETGEASNDLLKVEYVVTPSDNCSKAYPEGFWGEDWKMTCSAQDTGTLKSTTLQATVGAPVCQEWQHLHTIWHS